MLAAVGLVVIGLAAASCQTSRAGTSSGPSRPGGTLTIVVAARAVHLDPQRIRTATEANLSRLITRTLTTYRPAETNATGTEIVGDLATDSGRPSEGNRVWDFTLKPGLKWEDGTDLACTDVKHGVERGFNPGGAFDVAQPYLRMYLADNPSPYEGPYSPGNNVGRGLESVQCLSATSVRFVLSRPTDDFGRVVAATSFAPVPSGHDTRDRYDAKPFANGPYRVERVEATRMSLVRNPNWSRASDPVRRAYPDRIVVNVSGDADSLTNRILDDDGDWSGTVLLDQDASASALTRLAADADLSRRVVTGSSEGVRYFAINTRRVANPECRKALAQAFDRQRFREALGGQVAGDYATTMISPRLSAHRSFDLYGVEGAPTAAKQLLRIGSCPASITVMFPERRDVRRAVATMTEPYQTAGVQLIFKPIEADRYQDVVGNPDSEYDLAYSEWMPDWPSGAAVIAPLFSGEFIGPPGVPGTLNLSLLNDSGINAGIKAALAEPATDRQQVLWGQLDERTQALAATIPVLYPKATLVVGSNVRGAYVHPRFGQLDVCMLGLGSFGADPVGVG